MDIPQGGKDVANVLLDCISLYFSPGGETLALSNLALDRLNEIGAATATIADDTGVLTLKIDNITGGAMVTIQALIVKLANAEGRDPHEIIVDLREAISG